MGGKGLKLSLKGGTLFSGPNPEHFLELFFFLAHHYWGFQLKYVGSFSHSQQVKLTVYPQFFDKLNMNDKQESH